MQRIQSALFNESVQNNKIVLLQGPRNSGKKSFIHATFLDTPIQEITMDRSTTLESLQELLDEKGSIVILCDAHLFEELNELLLLSLEGKILQTLVLVMSFRPLLDEELYEALDQAGLIFTLFPPGFYETASHFGLVKESELLEERLIFGSYQQVTADLEHAELILRELVQDVIITHFGPKDRVNKGDKLLRVMQLLAFRIGEPVTNNDIGSIVGLDNETVERYIDLLADAFIVFRLHSYHTEQRYELKKSYCVYFWDNGIRNALISNFNPTFLRDDMVVLWKNYFLAERLKWININRIKTDTFFWRSHTRQQMDLLEISSNGTISAYKTDWEKRKKIKVPELFTACYPGSKTTVINRNNYLGVLSQKKG